MQRTSLVLSVAMSGSDLLLHVSVFFPVIDDEHEDDARNALTAKLPEILCQQRLRDVPSWCESCDSTFAIVRISLATNSTDRPI